MPRPQNLADASKSLDGFFEEHQCSIVVTIDERDVAEDQQRRAEDFVTGGLSCRHGKRRRLLERAAFELGEPMAEKCVRHEPGIAFLATPRQYLVVAVP